MMAGNPSWWSMHPPSHQQPSNLLSSSPSLFSSQYVLGSSPYPFNSSADTQELPQSWSQLLLGGLSGDEDKFTPTHFQPIKFENGESHQIINPSSRVPVVNVKQEVSQNSNLYVHGGGEFQASAWPQIVQAVSPRSCVTSVSSSTTNILDFSHTEADRNINQQQPLDHSSECNSSSATGGANKKARVQLSSSQPPLKVRKEKLGDRITALHQLVSPFGKTDTASVLLEAIGYIRFLQGQIEALSSPYLGTSSANMRNQQCVQGDVNGAFSEDTGQLLNDTCLKRKGALNQDDHDKPKDLRSRGLCLVPLSCTQRVGSDNGADYWTPALGGGF